MYIPLHRYHTITRAQANTDTIQNSYLDFETPSEKLMANFVGLTEAAKRFSISRSFLYKLSGKGEINFYRLGGKVLVDLNEIESKILTNKATAKV